jgi:hypothetical protein
VLRHDPVPGTQTREMRTQPASAPLTVSVVSKSWYRTSGDVDVDISSRAPEAPQLAVAYSPNPHQRTVAVVIAVSGGASKRQAA